MKVEVVESSRAACPWLSRSGTAAPESHLTIYGHYDVKPPDRWDEWKTPPFDPVIGWAPLRREFRGQQGQPHGRTQGSRTPFARAARHQPASIIEGEEEVRASPCAIRSRQRLEAEDRRDPGWDGGFDDAGNPTLVDGPSAHLYVELHARARVDLHSGMVRRRRAEPDQHAPSPSSAS